jgi:tRNA (guanine-N7-)-methyltransferase
MQQQTLSIKKTRDIVNPHYYIQALLGEYSNWAYDEERAIQFRGRWRQELGLAEEAFLDLEIGTGNGYFFENRAKTNPDRFLIGIEIKFKPLIQAVRRARNSDCNNIRGLRYDAKLVRNLFSKNELNDIFIHHPDPWSQRKKQKHRIVNRNVLNELFEMQRPGSLLEFKTDSREYFLWAMEEFKHTPFVQERYTLDLHASEWASVNFVTHFEKLFTQQGVPINYSRWMRK